MLRGPLSSLPSLLSVCAVMAFSDSGRNMALYRPVNVTGGTIAAGTAAAVTDGISDAMGDAGLRVNFVAGATATILISFAYPANISTLVFVNKGAYSSGWGTNAAMSYNAGGQLELLDATGAVTWSSLLGSPGDTATVRVYQPGSPIVLAPPPASQTWEQQFNGIRYIQMNPASNYMYIREVRRERTGIKPLLFSSFPHRIKPHT